MEDLQRLGAVFAVPTMTFWSWSFFFLYVDLKKRPRWLAQRKIQADVTSWVKFREAASDLLRQQRYFLLFAVCAIARLRSCVRAGPLPPLADIGKFVVTAYAFHAVCFYYLHRLLHVPILYKWIHHIHHRWQAPTAIATISAHPLENIFVNAGPLVLVTAFCKPHIASLAVVLALATTQAAWEHSGYRLLDNGHHDAHHQFRNCNYGHRLLDRMHGTAK